MVVGAVRCFSDCRLCLISVVPVLNTFNIAHTYNVSAGQEGLVSEPICGIVLPAASVCTSTCAILSCIQIFVVRSKFHEEPFNIPGTCSFCPLMVEDLCCAFCCGWCSIQQAQRHMCTVTTTGPAYLFAPDATNTMNDTLESKEV